MEAYLLAGNILRFKARLAETTDETQRKILESLLEEAEGNLRRVRLGTGPDRELGSGPEQPQIKSA